MHAGWPAGEAQVAWWNALGDRASDVTGNVAPGMAMATRDGDGPSDGSVNVRE